MDFCVDRRRLEPLATQVVFTGCIDEFFGHRFGRLEYRSLRFEDEIVTGDFQGRAIVNYPEQAVPFTRICEHKHFAGQGRLPESVITREYPADYAATMTPYYPVRDARNAVLYDKYRALATASNVIFGGRLGTFQYFDMHQVIAQAMSTVAAVIADPHRARAPALLS